MNGNASDKQGSSTRNTRIFLTEIPPFSLYYAYDSSRQQEKGRKFDPPPFLIIYLLPDNHNRVNFGEPRCG
jgi:hypothetical protein